MTEEEIRWLEVLDAEHLHSELCAAIQGPEGETWTVERDCNCWKKDVRDFLAEQRYDGSSPAEA